MGTLKGMERSMKTVYGDTSGTLSKYKMGKSQSLPDHDGDKTQSYTIFGDARYITDHARGGGDRLIGFFGWTNLFYGDALGLSRSAIGGNDTFTLKAPEYGSGSSEGGQTTFYGDAKTMNGSSVGGRDRFVNDGDDQVSGTFYGDAHSMSGKARGGADTYSGKGGGGTIFGDAYSMKGATKGGNDKVIGSSGSATSIIYGDAYDMSGTAKGGNDSSTSTAASAPSTATLTSCATTAQGGNDTIESTYFRYIDALFGDAKTMTHKAVGGDDTFNVTGQPTLYGDAETMTNDTRAVTTPSTWAAPTARISCMATPSRWRTTRRAETTRLTARLSRRRMCCMATPMS
jgi:hypothetical protein